jgi:hypothetical protein
MVVGFITYLCTQYLSPLTLSVRTPLRRDVLDTTIWLLRSNLNIVESGVKQHNPNPNPYPRTLIFFKPRRLISQNLNELKVIQSSIFVILFLSEHYSTADSSTQGNRSDGNNGGQVL